MSCFPLFTQRLKLNHFHQRCISKWNQNPFHYRSQSNHLRTSDAKESDGHHQFITTPIFYVNSSPHLGHLYSMVVSDAYFRYHQLRNPGRKGIFVTGTDEHGLKIQKAATDANEDCQSFCDRVSSSFHQLADKFNISNTDYIRTSSDKHKQVVKQVWKQLSERGYIYQDTYAGWYSVSDETFVPETQTAEVNSFINRLQQIVNNKSRDSQNVTKDQISQSTDQDESRTAHLLLEHVQRQLQKIPLEEQNKQRMVDIETGNLLEHCEEQNYMFRLSSLQDRLIQHFDQNPNFIMPEHFYKFIYGQLQEQKLKDISISRAKQRFYWGIDVPGDSEQIIYVWFDALFNYLTAGGFSTNDFTWPPTIQVIGKDILKFHSIYWPAFLLAMDLQPPQRLHTHCHWTIEGMKMSKSKGNVVDPFALLPQYRADGLRYFLLRTGVPHSDGNFSEKQLLKCVNAELSNTLGNLLQRSTNVKINKNQTYPNLNGESLAGSQTIELWDELNQLAGKVDEHFAKGDFYLGIDEIMRVLRDANLLFHNFEPWKLAKQEENTIELNQLLAIIYESLRISSILLWPIVPECSEMVLKKLNCNLKDQLQWDKASTGKAGNSGFQICQENLIVYNKIRS